MDVDLIMAVNLVSPVEVSAADLQQRRGAVSVSALILFFFVVWLGLQMPIGIMSGTDELLTAERTREMLLTEPWVVHYNFHRSFEKPPLQYWLTCLTLPRFQNRAIGVRIWPLVYGVCTAVAFAWLIFLIKPEEPWLIPVALVILISGPLFAAESARGLLDIGLAFFTLLTIVFSELARRNSKWWLGAAIACWLGSLQKMPVSFLIWVLILIVRLTNRNERANLRKGIGWLVGSLLLACALMSIWPLIQILKYQMPVFRVYHEEVVVWLGPEGLGQKPYLEVPLRMLLTGGLCGALAFLSPFLILFSKKERAARGVWEIALVSIAFIALVIVFNFRHVRYVIPIVPSLCFILALIFYHFLKQAPSVRAWTVAALVILLISGFVHTQLQIQGRKKNVADEKLIAKKLGELERADTETVLIKAIVPGNDLLWDSFYLFHGNFRHRVTKLTVDEIRHDPPNPPLIGACIARDLPVVKELYPNAQIVLTRAQFVCWKVPGE
jgi:4-amino-4-deoxy-L-arabinose transferase-like glycosyltransferase